MISNAKVSLSTVSQFNAKAKEVRDFSSYFESGLECIDNMQTYFATSASSLRGTLSAMQGVRSRISATKIQCENEIGRLTRMLNELNGAPSNKIQAIESEIKSYRERLDRAKTVDNRINAHMEVIRHANEFLEESQNTCRQLKAEIDAIRSRNMQIGTVACDGLKKIEEIVTKYLQTKLVYEEIRHH